MIALYVIIIGLYNMLKQNKLAQTIIPVAISTIWLYIQYDCHNI